MGYAFPFYRVIELFRSRKQTPQQPEALEYREPLRIEEVSKTTPRAIKPNEDLLGKLMLRQWLKMAQNLPALKASEESFDDSGADVDFESSDSNSASSIDDEEIASIDRSEGNKTNILPSIIEIDGKQCVKINNKTYLL